MNSKIEIPLAVIFILLSIILSWFLLKQNILIKPIYISLTTSTTASTTTTTVSTTTIPKANRSLTREVFLDIKSGEGLPGFSDAAVDDVRAAMRIWEKRTSHIINFEEVGKESVADIIIRFSESFNTSYTGRKTIGEASVYLNEVRGSVYILPSAMSCRNQIRAMHEIGHVIGLNHSTAYSSAMYPIESCTQNITDEDARAATELIGQFL